MPVEYKDYYEVLGVPREATDDQLKKAFRRLAMKHHPDKATDKKAAEEKFKEINEAYEVLGDPEKRRKYDGMGTGWREGEEFRPPPGWEFRTGPAPAGSEFHFSGTGFSDFFEQFFGRRNQSGGFGQFGEFDERGPVPERGDDLEGDILVTLEEVLRGTTRNVSVRRTNPQTGRSETQTYRVRIPAGVREGQRIRLAGRGEAGTSEATAGDLYLRVKLARHPDFRVRGADLFYDLPLAPWEAVLGAKLTMPTLEGRVTLTVPPGTRGGQQLRLHGKGLPDDRGGRGDLYAVVALQVPTAADAKERALWEQLAKQSDFNPRRQT